MAKIPEDVLNDLKASQTVGDLFEVLADHYDLDLIPSPLQKSFLISGLSAAIEAIKPVKKQARSRRRIVNRVQSF